MLLSPSIGLSRRLLSQEPDPSPDLGEAHSHLGAQADKSPGSWKGSGISALVAVKRSLGHCKSSGERLQIEELGQGW